MKRSALLVGPVVAAALVTAGCSTTTTGDPAPGVTVLASFYPLQYVAQQVGGDAVTVSSLTPPGAEPHDLELSPSQVRAVGDADVVLVLSGFQPSVDEAVAAREPAHLVDAATVPSVAEHMAEGTEGSADEHADEEEGAEDDGHDHASGDPHFWLDPSLMADLAPVVADALAAADPDHADDYAARADTLADELMDLDAELATGLATCERDVVVASHEAYGYLAERYGLTQVGLSGLDPEAEPSPARLREIRDVVAQYDVTTIFTESLVNPKVAQTLADDLGLATAVLDPIESQVDDATDYRGAMQQNLEALRAALGCS